MGDRNYLDCPACLFMALDPAQRPGSREQRDRYLLHDNSAESPGYREMLDEFLRSCVDPFVRPPGRALDFGCGPLPEGGVPVLVALLRERGFETDFHDLHFAPDPAYRSRSYDLITLTEVLEHLPEPLEVLGELKSRLTGKGLLALSTRFHSRKAADFRDWWYRRDVTHVSFFAPETLRHMARKLGLEVLRIDPEGACVLGLH